jgi:outer membrane protein OmpA-like peptidoglycan-associated protein
MKSISVAVMFIALPLIGCSRAPPKQAAPIGLDPRVEYAEVTWPEGMPPATRYIHLTLGEDARGECAHVQPHFQFDEHELRAQDVDALKGLADCLNAEPFRDRTVLLVGRADRTGTDTYNEKLGMGRAERVRKFLIEQGVDESRMRVLTRGERGAMADGFYSYGWDRRVDVILQGGHAHRPTYSASR